MKTQKRFTAQLLARFEKLERGTGNYENYIPWHRVGRGDPSSQGRSHLYAWYSRHREFLSDGELVAFYFATMHPEVFDVREQFPLSLTRSLHHLKPYSRSQRPFSAAGTLEIAELIGIKHPTLKEAGTRTNWILTTDLVITLKSSTGAIRFLAISVKPSFKKLKPREIALLGLEREYWLRRGVEWLLLTADLYDPLVSDLLKGNAHHALEVSINSEMICLAAFEARQFSGRPLSEALTHVAKLVGDMSMAQRAFWQAVWFGYLPLDLRRGWRPHHPLVFLS